MDGECVPSPWPELPPDLAGAVYCRLVSYGDRVRFRAVCRPWRLAARRQHPLPAALPWIALDRTTYESLPDGEVHRVPVPGELPADTVCRGAFDGWLLYESGEQRERCLRNPISMAKIDLPYHCDEVINPGFNLDGLYPTTVCLHEAVLRKIVVCSPDFLAAIIDYGAVLFLRPGSMHSTWSLAACPGYVGDIALYRGKLYFVAGHGELAVHDFSSSSSEASSSRRHGSAKDDSSSSCVDVVISTEPPLNNQNPPRGHFWDSTVYLVVSCTGKLLMVRWRRCLPLAPHYRHWCADELSKEIKVDVFEADLEKRRWSEVEELGEQALFVGTTCSKALPWPDHANCVFFLGLNVAKFSPDGTIDGIGGCAYCVYDMKNGAFSFDHPVSIERDFRRSRDDWFFPCDVVES
ncbi:F-box protein At2g17036-like [Oryza brachyantha]|uniref:F-box protein At2g17036-like n=1 Tax=Oryza brachyantha TaxID=4533 RepID=UPI001ADCBE72|nr:F-box protein At2g17036-like [Oryza brachyantha]